MDNKFNLWLQTCPIILDIAVLEAIHSEELTETLKNLALQRTGTEDMPLRYTTDKGWKKQFQYMLLLKSTSEDDLLRLTNLDWLDLTMNWLELQNKNKNYPILDDNRVVEKVSCANALTYQTSEDGAISIYSLQIYFDVRKKVFEAEIQSI
ncbi:MAG: hypothetical protein WC343_15695 [Bacilli bacterium]|jgi:hypothetical protein